MLFMCPAFAHQQTTVDHVLYIALQGAAIKIRAKTFKFLDG